MSYKYNKETFFRQLSEMTMQEKHNLTAKWLSGSRTENMENFDLLFFLDSEQSRIYKELRLIKSFSEAGEEAKRHCLELIYGTTNR